jgi:hypothetical protein
LPLQASRFLDRLLGIAEPLGDVEQVRAELAATRHQPARVTPDWRAAQVSVLAAFLFVGLLCMLLGGRFWSMFFLEELDKEIGRADAWLSVLDDEDLRKVVASHAGVRLENPIAVREYIGQRREQDLQARDGRRLFLRYTLGILLSDLEPPASGEMRGRQPVLVETDLRRPEIQQAKSGKPGGAGTDRLDDLLPVLWPAFPSSSLLVSDAGYPWEVFPVLMIGFFPGVWVFWALLFRGGLSVRLMGLALVRSNGGRALRIQCAWRALLVWAPVTALLLGSARLDFLSWQDDEMEGLAWLSLSAWWLALGLLITYFLLAFWRPSRSLHDRLAGTYVVPR